MRIYTTHTLHPAAAAMLEPLGDLSFASALDAATLTRESAEADIVIVRAALPEAMFSTDRPLRAAIRHGAGLDMIPLEAATRAGVLVANVPGANARTVAEHVVFVAMALLRRFRKVDGDLRRNGWLAGRAHADTTGELAGRTLGIVGMGAIGRELARIASAGFGMPVLAVTRRPDAPLPDGASRAELDDMLARADVVVLACPLTPETRHLIDARRIARMKPSAIIVNVSRGPVVEDEALIAALAEGRIAGAALDVFATQPLPADHPYLGFDTVIVTPHMAGITEESMERMGIGAAQEAARIARGELPVELRNPDAVPLYRKRFG